MAVNLDQRYKHDNWDSDFPNFYFRFFHFGLIPFSTKACGEPFDESPSWAIFKLLFVSFIPFEDPMDAVTIG